MVTGGVGVEVGIGVSGDFVGGIAVFEGDGTEVVGTGVGAVTQDTKVNENSIRDKVTSPMIILFILDFTSIVFIEKT